MDRDFRKEFDNGDKKCWKSYEYTDHSNGCYHTDSNIREEWVEEVMDEIDRLKAEERTWKIIYDDMKRERDQFERLSEENKMWYKREIKHNKQLTKIIHQAEEERVELEKFRKPHNCHCGADSFASRCNECGGYKQIGHGG